MKSPDADVISQMPKPKFVARSVVGKQTRKVPDTERASTEESKNKVALHEEYPISVGKISEQIGSLDEPRQCSNCTEDKTEDSILSSEIAKYGVSMFLKRAA